MRRPPLSLGDRIEAFGKLLPADAATVALLAEMLRPREAQGGLKSAARRAAAPAPSAQTPAPGDSLTGTKPDTGSNSPLSAPLPAPGPMPPTGTTKVTPLARKPFVRSTSSGLTSLAPVSGTSRSREPPPLISANQTRAILATLVARPHEGLAVDVPALLDRIERGVPLVSLPRREVWSVRRGVQLLVDCSAAVTPISNDIETIERRLVSILGKERLDHRYFAGCPSRSCGTGDRSTWKMWRPPTNGAPVIALTDLGCAGVASNDDWAGAEEWSRFAQMARAAGSTLVVLLPFPVQRVPMELARCITVVPWNESLSAARVRRILADASSHVHA
ncbi:MAG: hypothetical protein ABW220_11270 [Burkholderiaceae bacterium]